MSEMTSRRAETEGRRGSRIDTDEGGPALPTRRLLNGVEGISPLQLSLKANSWVVSQSPLDKM